MSDDAKDLKRPRTQPSLVFNEPTETGWIRLETYGDPQRAMGFVHQARTQLGQMKTMYGMNEREAIGEAMGFYHQTKRANDGTLIQTISNGDLDTVRITAPRPSRPAAAPEEWTPPPVPAPAQPPEIETPEIAPPPEVEEPEITLPQYVPPDVLEYLWVGIKIVAENKQSANVFAVEPRDEDGNYGVMVLPGVYAVWNDFTSIDMAGEEAAYLGAGSYDGPESAYGYNGASVTAILREFTGSFKEDWMPWIDADVVGSVIITEPADLNVLNWTTVRGLRGFISAEAADYEALPESFPWDPKLDGGKVPDGVQANDWDIVLVLDPTEGNPLFKPFDSRPGMKKIRQALAAGGVTAQVQSGQYVLAFGAVGDAEDNEWPGAYRSRRAGEGIATLSSAWTRQHDFDFQNYRFIPEPDQPDGPQKVSYEVEVRLGKEPRLPIDPVTNEVLEYIPQVVKKFTFTVPGWSDLYQYIWPYGFYGDDPPGPCPESEKYDMDGYGPNPFGINWCQTTLAIDIKKRTAVAGTTMPTGTVFQPGSSAGGSAEPPPWLNKRYPIEIYINGGFGPDQPSTDMYQRGAAFAIAEFLDQYTTGYWAGPAEIVERLRDDILAAAETAGVYRGGDGVGTGCYLYKVSDNTFTMVERGESPDPPVDFDHYLAIWYWFVPLRKAARERCALVYGINTLAATDGNVGYYFVTNGNGTVADLDETPEQWEFERCCPENFFK